MITTVIYSLIAVIINYFTYSRQHNKLRVMILTLLIFVLSFCIPICIKLYSYFYIYKEAKRQQNNIATLNRVVYTNADGATIDDDSSVDALSVVSGPESPGTPDKNCNRVSWTASPIMRKKSKADKRPCSPVSEVDDNGCVKNGDLRNSDSSQTEPLLEKPCNGCSDAVAQNIHQKTSEVQPVSTNFKRSSKYRYSNAWKYIPKQTKDDSKEQSMVKPKIYSVSVSEPLAQTLIVTKQPIRKRSISCPVPPSLVITTNSNNSNNNSSNTKRTLSVEQEIPENCQRLTMKRASSPRLMARFRSISTGSPLFPGRGGSRKGTPDVKARREHKIRLFRKELRAAKVVALIMGTFIVCWAPFMSLNLMYAFDKLAVFFDPRTLTRMVMFAKDLHYINSAINPVLYVVLNKVYRSAIFKIIRLLKNKLGCKN